MRPSTDHVLLVGSMGAGKTTVGREVATSLGRELYDSDEQIRLATGRTVPELLAEQGEAAYRREEANALHVAVVSSVPAVVAVAGGAVLDSSDRALIARSGSVIWLRASAATVASRVGRGDGRVLLGEDPRGVAARLVVEREPLYAEVADAVVDVDELSGAEVVTRVLEALLRRVRVDVPGRPYDVVVGPGASRVLAEVIPQRARRAVVVTQASIGVEVEPGIETLRCTIPEGEQAKSLATVEALCRELSRAGVTRHDVVVAVGGGVVTDTAGFAASCYHRGMEWVSVATTLLGQVDAAIGGKTGVNLPEGKNLVGAFWQPRAVLCDTGLLATLPEAEWRSGWGEMAKYAFLGVEDLERLTLPEQVRRCVALKADVVASDEREGGRRMLLNYGHTLAHALEASGFAIDAGEQGTRGGGGGVGEGAGAGAAAPLRHGEAVAIGLVFAARLARLLGRIDDARVDRHVEVVRSYGLPTALPAGAVPDELVLSMGRDKKATDGLTFVLDGPDGVDVVVGVAPEHVRAALTACASDETAS